MSTHALHADPRNCPVVVGCDDDAAQSIIVCNEPLPCDKHDAMMDVAAARIGVEVLAEKLGTLRNAALELLGVYDHPDLDAKHLRRAVDDLAQALDETQL